MAQTTKVAAIFGILVFLQVSCAVSGPQTPEILSLDNVPAVMTVKGFQLGEGRGGPAACDGQYHSDFNFVVSLSSEWYAGGLRCGKTILIKSNGEISFALVVDECAGCDNELGASAAVWHSLRLDPSLGQVKVTWSDFN